MMPHHPVLDMMRRTMSNLAFVEHHASKDGPFEVTQLINSFLGALAHPWESLRAELPSMSLSEAREAGWPIPEQDGGTNVPQSLGDLFRLLRNGIAHGHLNFLPDGSGQIQAVRIANRDRNRLTWRAVITVRDMRAFLNRFVAEVEEIESDAYRGRQIA